MELLSVVAIVGVLVALVLPAVNGIRRAAFKAQCVSNLRQIGICISLYQGEHNSCYPPPLHGDFRYGDSTQPGLSQMLEPYFAYKRARDKWGNTTTHVDIAHSCPLYKQENIAYAATSVGYGSYAYRHMLSTAYDADGNPSLTAARLGGHTASRLAGDTSAASWDFSRWTPGQFGLVFDKGWTDYPKVTVPHDYHGKPAHDPTYNVLFADLRVEQFKWVHHAGRIAAGVYPNVPPELRNDEYGISR